MQQHKDPSEFTGAFRFVDAYLTGDRRILGVFRIIFGLILLFDLARRVPEAARLYSNEGVLSNHFLLFTPQASPQFSLLFACSSTNEVLAAFGVIGLVYALYCVGYATRLFQLLSLVAFTSLNSRNLFFADGGTATMVLLGTWTLFLPLGDRFSVDALLADAQHNKIRERIVRRQALKQPATSVAVCAILLQASAIYYFNAAHKTGWTWRHGEAVHLVLWQHRINTGWAALLARHEPTWFSPVMGWLTKRVEFAMPVLILFPVFQKYTRSAAFALAVGLHISIALLMTLGPFSYAMIALMWLCVPGAALDEVLARIPQRQRTRLQHLYCRALRAMQRRRLFGTSRSRPPASVRPVAHAFGQIIVALLVVVSIMEASNNEAIPTRYRLGSLGAVGTLLMYPRLEQSWSMFAPEAPTEDGTLVVDAVTARGVHIDPFTGAAPDFELGRLTPTPHSAMLEDYLFAMSLDANHRYYGELKRYIQHWRNPETPGDRIVAMSAWWVSYKSPSRGATTPGPAQRRLLLRF